MKKSLLFFQFIPILGFCFLGQIVVAKESETISIYLNEKINGRVGEIYFKNIEILKGANAYLLLTYKLGSKSNVKDILINDTIQHLNLIDSTHISSQNLGFIGIPLGNINNSKIIQLKLKLSDSSFVAGAICTILYNVNQAKPIVQKIKKSETNYIRKLSLFKEKKNIVIDAFSCKVHKDSIGQISIGKEQESIAHHSYLRNKKEEVEIQILNLSVIKHKRKKVFILWNIKQKTSYYQHISLEINKNLK